MADDLTQHVHPETADRLRAKAEALGLSFNDYLHGLVGDASYGWGENDDDPAIDVFRADHARRTGGFITLEAFDLWVDKLILQPA